MFLDLSSCAHCGVRKDYAKDLHVEDARGRAGASSARCAGCSEKALACACCAPPIMTPTYECITFLACFPQRKYAYLRYYEILECSTMYACVSCFVGGRKFGSV